jgi:mannose-1-phosphate guanylyltransferase/phosphomannomutase
MDRFEHSAGFRRRWAIYAGPEPLAVAEERYRAAFLQRVDRPLLEGERPTIVVDFFSGLFAPLGQRLFREAGCKLIELNAIPGEPETRSEANIATHLRTLSAVTKAVGATAGVLFNYSGTRMTIVSEQGMVLPPWHALAVMMLLSWHGGTPSTEIGVPLNAPRLIGALATADGNGVRTLAPDPVVVSGATMQSDLVLVGDGAGGFAFPELPAGFDALFGTVKMLEMLIRSNGTLSRMAAEVPPYFLASADAYCPWEHKGKVMRRLHEQALEMGGKSAQGVRLSTGLDTIVIVPDADKPVFHVQAEAETEQHAVALAERYAEMIRTYEEA